MSILLTKEQILRVCPTISSALQNMIDGLKMTAENPNLRADMGTWGSQVDSLDGPICYGCAATYSVFNIHKQLGTLNVEDIVGRVKENTDFILGTPSKVIESDPDKMFLYRFELAINEARYRELYELFSLYEVPLPDTLHRIPYAYFMSGNNIEPLPRWQMLADAFRYVEANGLSYDRVSFEYGLPVVFDFAEEKSC